jgi:hypothetical protein
MNWKIGKIFAVEPTIAPGRQDDDPHDQWLFAK